MRVEAGRVYSANRQRIASSRSSFFRHRIVDLKVGRSRHFIRQKCRFSPPHGEAARHSRLPFSGGPGSSAWRKSPNIQALPEGATTVADRGFNAAGSQRLVDWHEIMQQIQGTVWRTIASSSDWSGLLEGMGVGWLYSDAEANTAR